MPKGAEPDDTPSAMVMHPDPPWVPVIRMSDPTQAATRAEAKLLQGYNCAQAVLHANCGRLGFPHDQALQLACGFGAGMGQKEEVCGAVTGGVIALGLRYGRGEAEDEAKTTETYARTRKFMEKFAARHGSVICRDLIECDLLTPEGRSYYRTQDLLHQTCAACVRTAAALVDEMI